MKNKKNKLLKEDHKTIFFFFILEEENKEKEEHLDKEYDDKGRIRRIRLRRMQNAETGLVGPYFIQSTNARNAGRMQT